MFFFGERNRCLGSVRGRVSVLLATGGNKEAISARSRELGLGNVAATFMELAFLDESAVASETNPIDL
jgi:hypothetical protein